MLVVLSPKTKNEEIETYDDHETYAQTRRVYSQTPKGFKIRAMRPPSRRLAPFQQVRWMKRCADPSTRRPRAPGRRLLYLVGAVERGPDEGGSWAP